MAEHSVFHGMFDYMEKTLPKLETLAELKALGAVLNASMTPHSRVEEELFIEPLEHCLEQLGQNESFHDEHAEIEKDLANLQKTESLEEARQLLHKAVVASRKHFDKEERLVFPMGEQVLKSQTLNELGAEWMKRREATVW